ncbi:LAME_0C07470g1_1 [Lachancea meyersii CBS 8951]|uniref:LAME_0C07470g1_1 n=1 Tax=Lachancea meyersii CBS 8951 TaxID=1266667 RepID=A0A1G4J2V4_9SACH|nr:LAME_0C07470g1_1 [Lachancea meyersii CBS 8951]
MSGVQEEVVNNLKVIIAENLKTLPNFNEDVNYVAEYIVLLMSNGGNVESVVQELTSLFDTVPAEAFQSVAQNAYKAMEYLQSGDSLETTVAKLTGQHRQQEPSQQQPQAQAQPQPQPQQQAQTQPQQQQQQSQQQQQQQQQQQEQPLAPQQSAFGNGSESSIFASSSAASQPKSAFEGIVNIAAGPPHSSHSAGVSKGGHSQRGGGVSKFGGRGGRPERSERGGLTKPGSTRRNNANNNALAMALGLENPNVNFVNKKQGRCPLFPRCPLGKNCPHAHPTQACRDYPNCPNPPGTCNYLHPNEDVELMKEIEKTREEFREKRAAFAAAKTKPERSGIVLCKFGLLCTNPQCPFGHPTPANDDAKVITFAWCPENLNCQNPACDKAHSSSSKIREVAPVASRKPQRPPVEKSLEQCKFGPNCTNKRCRYRHARSHIMCRDGANCTRLDCLFGHPINEDCKFGVNCRNIYCLYKHPEGRELPQKPSHSSSSNNTWVNSDLLGGNSSINERPFAVPDNQVTESMPAQENDAIMG